MAYGQDYFERFTGAPPSNDPRKTPYMQKAFSGFTGMPDPNAPPKIAPSATQNAVAGASAAQGTEIARPSTTGEGGVDRGYFRANPTVLETGPGRDSFNTLGPVSQNAPNANQPYINHDRFQAQNSSARDSFVSSLPDMPGGMNTVQMPRSAGMFAPSEGPTIRVGTYTPPPQAARSGAPTWADMAARKESRFARTNAVNQQIADAATMRATNEFPLAQLQSSTAERGQDIGFMSNRMQDITSRRGQDVQQRGQNLQFDASAAADLTHRANIESVSQASKYRTDSELAARLPLMQQQDRINSLNDAGRSEDAASIASQGHPRAAQVPHTAIDSTSQHVITTHPSGRVEYNSMKGLQERAAEEQKKAMVESAAKIADDKRKREAAAKAEGR